MSEPAPVLHVIAGPNGAGKSTFADRFLLAEMRGVPFVNADLIEQAAREAGNKLDSYQASRQAQQIRDQLIELRRSFVFETVFSHSSKVELITQASAAGYLTTLHVLMVPVELAVVRVRLRAEQGGHAVPEEKVRQRHERLWDLVVEAISHTDEAIIYDSTATPKPVARFVSGTLVGSPHWPAWAPAELVALG